MKEFSKKISLCFMVLLGVLVMNFMVPGVVWAADSDFVIDENGVLVKYTGSDTDVVIPEGVTSIDDWVFRDCISLTSITIPDSVVSIGNYVFWRCSNLIDITIPDSVISIGDAAFGDCNNLTNITIPNSVISIGDGIFMYCSSLESITTPDFLTSINKKAFYACSKLTDIIIPDSVTSIGDDAFFGCSELTDIIIPNSVTNIGDSAFYNCSKLTDIIIPNSVTSIGNAAFFQCGDLTSITIAGSVTSIGTNVFSGCYSLKNINVSNLNRNYKDENGILFSKDGTKLIACPAGKDNINYIIPEGVVNIGSNAFYNCCLESITIPDSVTSIGDSTFYACYLTSITIPDSVISIGANPFRRCFGLTNINVSNLNRNYKDEDGILFSKDGTELIAYPAEKGNINYIIPEGVVNINNLSFDWCINLENIIIPNSVTNIDEMAFSSCNGLTSITIPNSVTNIGNDAFLGCHKLESIFIYNDKIQLGEEICVENKEFVTLYGHKDSTTEAYALQSGYNFKELEVLNPSITSNIVSIHSDEAFVIGNNIEVSRNTNIGMNLTIAAGSGGKLSVQKGTGIELLRGQSEIEISTGSAIATSSAIELDYLFDIRVDEMDEPQKIVFTLENITGEVCEQIEYMISKKESEPEPENKPLQSIRLSKTDINLVKDRTSLLKVFYDPEDTTDPRAVTWTSSNREVAIVYTNGKVKAIGKGTAVITAKVGNLTATCNVTVTE